MLSKKDLMLAQKTYEANKLKFERKNLGTSRVYTPQVIQRRLNSRQGSRKGSDSQRPSSMQGSSGSSRSMPSRAQTMSMARLDELDKTNLPQLDNPASNSSLHSPHSSRGSRPSTVSSHTKPKPKNAHDMTADELIDELAERGMTQQLALQKQQLKVASELKRKTGKVDYMDPDFDHEAMQREDYYMPKVTITRPDGATLMDIYRSKQADTWSLVLKSQLKEEEKEKVVKRQQKEEGNERYGRLLKEQLANNLLRDNGGADEDSRLAAIVEATSKAKDDEQQQRKADAVTRQKQFITHALEDIETKKIKREKELSIELEAAMKTNNKVKAAIANDVMKKYSKKDVEAARLASLWAENQAELARKAEIKRLEGEQNLRIFRLGEEKNRKDDARRDASLAEKMAASSDGRAHRITAEAKRRFAERENDFFRLNEGRDNMLNKQLMASEKINNSRGKGIGKTLLAAWDKSMAFKKKEDDAEAQRLRNILEYQKKQKERFDKEDAEKRDATRMNRLKYQRELDFQLNIARTRSQDALTKTMSDRERLYNSAMLMKTGMINSVDELVPSAEALS